MLETNGASDWEGSLNIYYIYIHVCRLSHHVSRTDGIMRSAYEQRGVGFFLKLPKKGGAVSAPPTSMLGSL